MADNLTVLNSTGATATIRMKDTTGSGGPLANMSIPTDVSGNTMVSSGTTFVSTAQSAAAVVISSLSAPHTVVLSSNVTLAGGTVTLSSNPTVIPSSAVQVTLTSNTVTLSSNPTVIISSASNQTVTSLSSGTVAISNGSNIANVVAGSSSVTSTMSALVVALSTLGNAGLSVSTISSGSFAIINGNNTVSVKPSGTAPSSTDIALVVTLSPNGINPNGQTTSSLSAPVVIASDQSAVSVKLSSTGFGGATSSLSTPTVPADQYGAYTVVGASLTQQSLGSSAGRVGDYLAYVTIFPSVAAAGAVTIFDSTGVTIGSFAGGGTTALPSLVPFRIDIGAYSISSGWKVTTSSNVTALGVGKFT